MRLIASSLAALVAMTGAACTSGRPNTSATLPAPRVTASSPFPSATASSLAPKQPASPSATAAGCPARYLAPEDNRPVVSLRFSIGADRRTVTGVQEIDFRPDLPVREIVLRQWPNSPRSKSGGGRMVVNRLRVDAGGQPAETTRFRSDTSSLLEYPLGREVAPGERILIETTFTVTLPVDISERMGTDRGTVWFASAHPMLAWEPGRGWARDPATAAFAEASTSASFRLAALVVTTDASDVVLATGARGQVTRSGGQATHRFTAPAVRDVMVAAGRFRVSEAKFGTIPVRVGVAPGMTDDPAAVARLTVAAMGVHSRQFGPFPYETYDVAVVPDIGGGIEYPAAMLLGPKQLDSTLTHEVAHEWFYGLVGNNQGRDPWLDESFATYAEALHRGSGPNYATRTPAPYGRHQVGQPMTYWERNRDTYFRAVYLQGATMLLEARRAAGAAAFDRAIRCYVAANAHRIATPDDLREALAGLPAAIRVLERYGALR